MQRLTLAIGLTAMLSACGGGSEISGTVLGLSAAGLTLSNGFETINVAEDATSFSFPTEVDDGKAYAVVVITQPSGLRCSVNNGIGTASANAPIADISVDCIVVWSLSGTISGLLGGGLVLNNGHEDTAVAAGALSFAFPTQLATGESYRVTVKTQPAPQTCQVSRGEGLVGLAAVSDVAVVCN